MIDELMPTKVHAVEVFRDLTTRAWPEEQALIGRAAEARRREFRTTRACARIALARMGEPAGPILTGPRGEPRWPTGIVGSMTHCRGYRAAAVARRAHFASIGIDAEPHALLPVGVLDVVSAPSERARLRELAGSDESAQRIHWDRLLFSAKESVYKTWYPLTKRMLDFGEAEITIDPGGVFTVRLLVPGPLVQGVPVGKFSGRWLVRDGLVLTAVTV